MVGTRRTPQKLTMDDARLYLTSVKKTFHDEPAKYKECLKVLNDYMTHRVSGANTIAKVEEVLKDHQKLLLGFKVFLPKAKRTIPPESNKNSDQFQTIIVDRRGKPTKTEKEGRAFGASVRKAFRDEPEKYDEFYKVVDDIIDDRIDADSGILCIEELMKGHRKLLLVLSTFLPNGFQITIPPESVDSEHLTAAHGNTKRKRAAPINNNRKRDASDEQTGQNAQMTRSQSPDTDRGLGLASEKPLKVYTRQRLRK